MSPALDDEPIVVAMSLCGDAEGLLKEFEVVLKSLIHNAPRGEMVIYVVADEDATVAVTSLIEGLEIDGRPWGSSVNVRVLNVQALTAAWREHVLECVPVMKEGHTFGSWYRLFLKEVLGDRARHVIYTDVDVVFLTSPAGLWQQRRDDVMVCWGESACSGVMLINVEILARDFWPLAESSIDKTKLHGDQACFVAIQEKYPSKFGLLSPAWDVHLADGAWRFGNALAENRPEVGFLHFNGGGNSKTAHFDHEEAWARDFAGWNLASYYIDLPWSWLFYRGSVDAEEAGSRESISVSYEVF